MHQYPLGPVSTEVFRLPRHVRHARLRICSSQTDIIYEANESYRSRVWPGLQNLKSFGLKQDDTTSIHLPMTWQAFLTCARTGAVHSVDIAGFTSQAPQDSCARVVITSDEGRRGGQTIATKAIVDAALVEAGSERRRKTAVSPTWHLRLVYIYSRMNFSRPPIGQIPGFKKPIVAVKFSPVLYELRPGVIGESGKEKDVASVVVEPGREDSVMADLNGPSNGVFQLPTSQSAYDPASAMSSPAKSMTSPSPSVPQTPISTMVPLPALPAPVTPLATPISTPAPLLPLALTSSVCALPYSMLFAVATMDTITIHDTQQSGPICLFTKLHYDEFTDMAWTPDGRCLLLSSRDGYWAIVIMVEMLNQHATQQPALQIRSIAYSHGADTRLPSASQTSAGLPFPTPSPTPSVPKRQLSPTPTEEGPGVSTLVERLPPSPAPTPVVNKTKPDEPSKRKRRDELRKWQTWLEGSDSF